MRRIVESHAERFISGNLELGLTATALAWWGRALQDGAWRSVREYKEAGESVRVVEDLFVLAQEILEESNE